MFSLQEESVRLVNVNPRAELHGEDPKPAADLKIHAKMSNAMLADFHPALRALLYVKDEGQKDLISENDPEHLTRLRMPKLGPLKFNEEIVGATVTVHAAVSKSDITLEGCTVDNFHVEPQEGGTIDITLRVQAHPDEKQMGKLYMLIGKDVEISIEPPEADAEEDPDGK